jgi:cell wall-associated NlpC family hydrolase
VTPPFATPERQQALLRIARSWIGTPFHPHGRIRGVGVDCVHLLAEIYREAGHLPDYTFPDYAMGSGEHLKASQVQAWLDTSPRFAHVEGNPQAGDVACFRLGRVAHHVGLVTDRETFIHALRTAGVIESMLEDPTYAKRLVALYRPVS